MGGGKKLRRNRRRSRPRSEAASRSQSRDRPWAQDDGQDDDEEETLNLDDDATLEEELDFDRRRISALSSTSG